MTILQSGLFSPTGGAYQISRSLRFNSANSAYLNRTPASAGNRKTWTWSGWVKRSALAANNILLSAGSDGSNRLIFNFNTTDNLTLSNAVSSSLTTIRTTTAVYRDVSAWYHIVLAIDTTQATAANRTKLYVNGVEVTAFSTSNDFTQNYDGFVDAANAHNIGLAIFGSAYANYYLTEVNFIDGSALTPSSFGETNPSTGVWQPIKYTGTYGTNGFYLNFSDNSGTTSTTLGKDSSGNGNNWTPNNFSVTAGAGNDSLVDTPTSYGTDTGVGGEVRGNYCTFSPIDTGGGSVTLSGGNLNYAIASSTGSQVRGTVGTDLSSKWYWEFTNGTTATPSTPVTFGISTVDGQITNNTTSLRLAATIYTDGGSNFVAQRYINGVNTSVTTQFRSAAIGDVIQVAYDAATGNLWFGKNNTWYDAVNTTTGSPSAGINPVFTLPVGSAMTPFVANLGASYSGSLNCGQRPFAYTAPSGFKALCTTNLPEPVIKQGDDYFNVVLYTGNGVQDRTITGVGFQPDFVWIKNRGASENHVLYNAVTGGDKQLFSSLTNAEQTNNDITNGFASDGFIVGDNLTGTGSTNGNTNTYVAWNWKANGTGVTNTAGTITSTVSANTTAGFSIVAYTGTGAAATIGHGLGVAPKMIIVKSRDQGTTGYTGNWYVYHASNTSAPETDYLLLNTTAGTADDTFWNDTAPTSTVFSVGALSGTNDSSDKFVAYCFAEVAGYSKFGSYTGNGSADGPFVFTNHRPAFLLIKRTDTTSNWTILDLAREGYNVDNDPLFPNLANAEGTTDLADILSNGFKLRSTDASVNANTGTYIYMSLASNPFKYSLAR